MPRRGWRDSLASVIAVLGGLAALSMLAGLVADHPVEVALADHFQAQYALALGAVTIVLGALRRWRATVAFALLAAIPLARVVAVALPRGRGEARGPRFTVMLSNVHSESDAHARVVDEVRRVDPEVVAFDEVNARWAAALQRGLPRWTHRFVVAREDNFGVAVFSRLPMEARAVYLADGPVPSVLARVSVGGREVTVIATHPVPAMDARGQALRDAALSALDPVVPRGGPAVVIGDLNATPWSRPLRALRARTGLIDSLAGQGVQPSWPVGLPWVARIPIDHVYVTRDVAVLHRELGRDVGSDHYPVVARLALQ